LLTGSENLASMNDVLTRLKISWYHIGSWHPRHKITWHALFGEGSKAPPQGKQTQAKGVHSLLRCRMVVHKFTQSSLGVLHNHGNRREADIEFAWLSVKSMSFAEKKKDFVWNLVSSKDDLKDPCAC
jgi:hypothetical protein